MAGTIYVYPAGQNDPRLPLVTYGAGGQTVQTSVASVGAVLSSLRTSGTRAVSTSMSKVPTSRPRLLAVATSQPARHRRAWSTQSGTGLRKLGDGASKDFRLGTRWHAEQRRAAAGDRARPSVGCSADVLAPGQPDPGTAI